MSASSTSFRKGSKRPPRAGRKKGTPNKVTKAYKDFLQELIDDPQVRAGMLVRARIGKIDVLAVGDRVVGRPAVQVEVAGLEAMADSYREALKAAMAAAAARAQDK